MSKICSLFLDPKYRNSQNGRFLSLSRFLYIAENEEFFEKETITPTSMMDISDGLSSELLHICKQSQLGCVLYEDKLPVADATRQAAFKFELDPTACALSGGEDYELLFTISQADHDKLVLNEQISVVGYMTEAAQGAHIITKGGSKHTITAQGWNHLK